MTDGTEPTVGEPLYELDQAGLDAMAEARAGSSGGSGQGGDLVLLYHFEGFMDAGHAAEQVIDHVLSEKFQFEGAGEDGQPGNPVVARFDTDRLVDYRAQRPTMTFDTDHWSDYEAPTLDVKLGRDATGTPFLVMYGPEPDTEWERFTKAMIDMVDKLGVTLSVNFHGIPFAVPHTRPTTLIPHGNRQDLLAGYTAWFDRAQIPHYISRSPYPAAAVRILEAITSATGLVLPAQELHTQAQRVEAEIESQVAQGDDDLRSMIHGLEVQYDTVAGSTPQTNLLADQAVQIPTAEELARQFEQFLAEQDRDT